MVKAISPTNELGRDLHQDLNLLNCLVVITITKTPSHAHPLENFFVNDK